MFSKNGFRAARLALAAVALGGVMATASVAAADGRYGSDSSRPAYARSYINPDIGAATANPDVNANSSCATPDRYDEQQLSDPGTTNRNVHNDACLFDYSGNRVDAPATFESTGVGVISACPDPDGAGPKTATLTDTNGDGRMDRCVQTGYQTGKGSGDTEFHARLNNTTTAGTQNVVWCYDPNLNGCSDEYIKQSITIKWNGAGSGNGARPAYARSYINRDTGAATENADVNMNSSCATPDRYDEQLLSDAGATNRNVHNDACLFDSSGNRVDAPATFESTGAGYISACPDPDGAGPKTATLTDTNGDGRMDRCVQTGFQTAGMGATEFHARLNNNTTAGTQYVVWCYDPNLNGCSDEYIKQSITIKWNGAGSGNGDPYDWSGGSYGR